MFDTGDSPERPRFADSKEATPVSETFQCPNCGAPLDYDGGRDPVIRCPYCSSGVVVPENLRFQDPIKPIASGLEDPLLNQLLQPESLRKIQEIKRLARSGQKIEAIRQYREVFKTSLREASEAVEKLAEGKPIAISFSSFQPSGFFSGEPPNPLVESEIRQILQNGNKIEAIKRYREIYQTSLKASKEAIEQLQRTGVFTTPPAGSGAISDGPTYPAASISISGPQIAKAAVGVAGGISCMWALVAIIIILAVVVPTLIALASPGGPLEGVWNQVNPLAFARVSLSVGAEGSGPGLFDDPRAIAVDPSGNVYVANYSDGRIQKFDPSGNFLMLWNIGTEKYLSSLSVDRAGNVYAVYRGKLWKYNGSDGQLIGQLELPGEPRMEMVTATADGGLIAAVSTEDYWRYDSHGQILFSLADVKNASFGDSEGVDALAVDGVGNVFMMGDSSYTVYKYSPDGLLLARFGSSGDEAGQFRAPLAMAIDGQGRIYVSDIKGIQVFAPDGRYLEKFDTEGVAFGLAFNDQGDLWATTNSPRLLRYSIKR